MKRVMVELYTLPSDSVIQELVRLVGFGVGAFTHIFTHKVFWHVLIIEKL